MSVPKYAADGSQAPRYATGDVIRNRAREHYSRWKVVGVGMSVYYLTNLATPADASQQHITWAHGFCETATELEWSPGDPFEGGIERDVLRRAAVMMRHHLAEVNPQASQLELIELVDPDHTGPFTDGTEGPQP